MRLIFVLGKVYFDYISRYNSRDTAWWMLQAIQDYVNMVPSGLSILSEQILRRFPADDQWIPWDDPRAYTDTSTLADIIQEILQRHASGITFREHNAGPDRHQEMKDNGFNFSIYADWKTGFIFGGNGDNCGTWMDKMGESVQARTKGLPATPRDGAVVEIIGLVKSTVKWLDKLSAEGKFPYRGVVASGECNDALLTHTVLDGLHCPTVDDKDTFVTYRCWNDQIQQSFERCFHVPLGNSTQAECVVVLIQTLFRPVGRLQV